MIARPLGITIARRCARVPLATATGGGAPTPHDGSRGSSALAVRERCPLAAGGRALSSMPHYLARKNNGLVNVIVKSTKVPRPVAMIPPKRQRQPKVEDRFEEKAAAAERKPKENASRREEERASKRLSYAGNADMPITSELRIVLPGEDAPLGIWPVFRMMDESGDFRQAEEARRADAARVKPRGGDLSELRSSLASQHPHFAELIGTSALLRPSEREYPDTGSDDTLLRAHRQMVRLRVMDDVLHSAQRQGRISFYLTHRGEEAIHMGSASALSPQDHVFAQYREAGVLMWRGFTLGQFCDQCFSNDLDLGRGRQMPVHYGCRALNYHTVSSPLGTQITQAVGAAYKFKLDALAGPGREAAVSVVYFGDGAASTVDFHSACNFAATLKAPVIFFCRNNGYAISTPVEDQYAGDGIVSRAPGYGMAGVRVDGNDVFAVHAAVAEARRLAVQTSSPVMVEAMTYRQGHHSTSDDSSQYRDADEAQAAADGPDPVARLGRFLRFVDWMDGDAAASIEGEERDAVLRAMDAAEARPDPKLNTMFRDVYRDMPPHLVRQEEGLRRHLKRHGVAHP